MNIKSKYFKTIAGLSAGAILLTVAVFANYDDAKGYTRAKNSVKKVLYMDNMSIDYSLSLSVDNKKLLSTYNSMKMNAGGNPSYRYENTYEDDNTSFSFTQIQDNLKINKMIIDGNEEQWYYTTDQEILSVARELDNGNGNGFGDKMIGFVETVADVFVGDLKNNFVLTEEGRDGDIYALTLTREQMPAYVNSGVSLMGSVLTTALKESPREDESSGIGDDRYLLLNLFGSGEPYVKDVDIRVGVDKSENPNMASFKANFVGYDGQGKEHIMTACVDFTIYDIGTTRIDKISDEELSHMEDQTNYWDAEITAIYDGDYYEDDYENLD